MFGSSRNDARVGVGDDRGERVAERARSRLFRSGRTRAL